EACNQFSNPQVGQDVWFTYTAACDGALTFSLCGAASYDTKLAVYEGTGCADLDARIKACNDDTTGCGLTSTVTVNATAGTHYLIRIGGYGAAQGTGPLQISSNPTCGGSSSSASSSSSSSASSSSSTASSSASSGVGGAGGAGGSGGAGG